jgi:hypothetical protein
MSRRGKVLVKPMKTVIHGVLLGRPRQTPFAVR